MPRHRPTPRAGPDVAAVIGATVALACVLIVLGLIVRALFGTSTVLKLGVLVFVVALLPSLAVGLYGSMAAATPGGMGGFGAILILLILSALAFVAFKVWLSFQRGPGRSRGNVRVERKRPIYGDGDDD